MATRPTVKSGYAYEVIRGRILDGGLPPGTRLRLRHLATELDLSEMPVREALRMLQRDGLVEIEDHRGATVTAIRLEDVAERIGVRMWLEVLAMDEAAPRHDAASLRTARSALARLARAAEAGDGGAFSRENRAFHEALEAPAGPIVRGLIGEIWDRVWQARRQTSLFVLDPGRMAAAQAEHEELLDAVERGDAAAAADAMDRHRSTTIATWQRAVASTEAP